MISLVLKPGLGGEPESGPETADPAGAGESRHQPGPEPLEKPLQPAPGDLRPPGRDRRGGEHPGAGEDCGPGIGKSHCKISAAFRGLSPELFFAHRFGGGFFF